MDSTSASGISRILKVRCSRMEGKLDLIFDDRWGTHHELLRCEDEPVSNALKRIELSILKKSRKRKSDKESVSLELKACLYTSKGDLIGGEVPNGTAWMEEGILQVGLDHYTVQVNPPSILSLKLPKCSMTGCPVIPEVSMN